MCGIYYRCYMVVMVNLENFSLVEVIVKSFIKVVRI